MRPTWTLTGTLHSVDGTPLVGAVVRVTPTPSIVNDPVGSDLRAHEGRGIIDAAGALVAATAGPRPTTWLPTTDPLTLVAQAGVYYSIRVLGVGGATIPSPAAGATVSLDDVLTALSATPPTPSAQVALDALDARLDVLEAGGGGGGVTDHGMLTGLGDDDHTQYLTAGRGDARYAALGDGAAAVSAHLAAGDPHPAYATAAEAAAAAPVQAVAGRTGAVTLVAADVSDSTAVGRSVLTATDATAARAAIGASSLALGTTAGTAAEGTDPRLSGRYVGVNAQTGTTYTPVASDEGKLVTLSNAAAITVTLPQDSDLAMPVGARIDMVPVAAGMVTFVAGTGATVNGTPSLVTRAQWSAATVVKRAANTWLVVGDLA